MQGCSTHTWRNTIFGQDPNLLGGRYEKPSPSRFSHKNGKQLPGRYIVKDNDITSVQNSKKTMITVIIINNG